MSDFEVFVKPVVYISGPMSGYEDYNKSAFAKAAAFLREKGYKVVSPPEVTEDQESLSYTGFLARDMQAMLDAGCNTICLLQGWSDSLGARIELQIAWALKWQVWYYDSPEDKLMNMGRIKQ